jgi:predicted amidophosphoribosyltransferase
MTAEALHDKIMSSSYEDGLEAIKQYAEQFKCQSCGKPLSRDCPRCERLWES